MQVNCNKKKLLRNVKYEIFVGKVFVSKGEAEPDRQIKISFFFKEKLA